MASVRLCNNSLHAGLQAPAVVLQSGVLRCFVPPHAPGVVRICITHGDGRPRSRLMSFEYRAGPPADSVPRNKCATP